MILSKLAIIFSLTCCFVFNSPNVWHRKKRQNKNTLITLVGVRDNTLQTYTGHDARPPPKWPVLCRVGR